MQEISNKDPLGFNATTFDFTALGRFGGFCQQEFVMDSKTEIKYYVMSEGTTVFCAFTFKNFIFYDKDDVQLVDPLLCCQIIRKLGIEFDIQQIAEMGR